MVRHFKIILITLTLLFGNKGFSFNRIEKVRPPGVIVDYNPYSTGKYIGSPSIIILSNGDYIATHDYFGKQAFERKLGVTVVFRSKNKGKTWNKVSTLQGQFWSNIFEHNKELYIIGTNKEYGDFIIRKSVDSGNTWTTPENEENGIIFKGRFHTAPVPIITFDGKIWRAVEELDKNHKNWGKMFMASMAYADINSDLLQASSWKKTNNLPFNGDYLDGSFGAWLEGNAVVDVQANKVVNILRVHTNTPNAEKAAYLTVNENELNFDQQKGFINFPGGSKKFTIRYDEITKRYYTLSNIITKPYDTVAATDRIRNTIALCYSNDLKNWKIAKTILHHPDMYKHGFQYIDWQFEGNNIVFVSRTAYDDEFGGVGRQHDANYLTFHRIKKFRKIHNEK
ncbi:sialidase family protein [Pedobacter sp. ASV1-7]|uniref:sialidase family protein n=1 Tax=Pedobacter sp. ASV1-7 TaxID=3145237 RepID=UPI0032E8B4BA